MKIYLAGPLFTSAEREWNVQLARQLTRYGFEIWLPQEQEPVERTARNVFFKDVEGLDWTDVVVANMDGPDPDSGTAWECGYAYAKGKPVLAYRTDFRSAGDAHETPYNLMLSESATERRVFICMTVEEAASAISSSLRTIEKSNSTEDRLEPSDPEHERVRRVAQALDDELRNSYFKFNDSTALARRLLAAADRKED